MSEELLIAVCEIFNLEPEVSLGLLDSYFCENRKDFLFLESLELGLKRHEDELITS